VLNKDGCEALITAYRSRIFIVVIGEYKKKREFMAILRHIIDYINIKLNSQINRLIPLPGIKDGFVEYERLLIREKNGKTDYRHNEDKPTEKVFKISELLDGIPSDAIWEELKSTLYGIKKDTEIIKNKMDLHLEYLISLTRNSITMDDIQKVIKKINAQQTTEMINEFTMVLTSHEKVFNDKLDEKLRDIYTGLKQTEDVQAKLSLSIPFINLLGINFDVEFDVKSWAKKMYDKFGLLIFKKMGV
jgi:hypothetical protein